MSGGGIRGLPGGDAMIALLFAGLASIAMANSMVFPLLGPLGRSVGLSDGQIGAMHAAAAVGAIAAAPWWGRQADRYGRRTVFALSLLGLAVSTFLLVVGLGAARAALIDAPQSFALLLAARLAYGVLASGALPAPSSPANSTLQWRDRRAPPDLARERADGRARPAPSGYGDRRDDCGMRAAPNRAARRNR